MGLAAPRPSAFGGSAPPWGLMVWLTRMPRRRSQTVRGVRGWAIAAPRGAVVHEQAVGQAIDAEDGAQPFLHRPGALVGACLRPMAKREWSSTMVSPASAGASPSARGPGCSNRSRGARSAMAMRSCRSRRDARAGHRAAVIEQHLAYGAASPVLLADPEDGLLERSGGVSRVGGAVYRRGRPSCASGRATCTRWARDREAPAQLPMFAPSRSGV